MHLAFKQIKNKEEQKIFSKPNLSSDFKPKFFMVLGLILMLLFGIYWFMAKPDKAEKQRADLNYLKTKVKNGEELDANQRSSFCELLWLVEKTAVADCEKLTLGQFLEILTARQSEYFSKNHEQISKIIGITMDSFEIKKSEDIIPVLEESLNPKIKKYLKDKEFMENPDVGYWGKLKYGVFRASSTNSDADSKKIRIYTIIPLKDF